MIEWPDVNLGRSEMVQVLPSQQGDGTLTRSQIRLADVSLAGLIAEQPIVCTRAWDAMMRSAPE
jgi:hypothetical protein